MATSSITKEFYVKDPAALERLKKELERKPARRPMLETPSMKKGKEKVTAFAFR